MKHTLSTLKKIADAMEMVVHAEGQAQEQDDLAGLLQDLCLEEQSLGQLISKITRLIEYSITLLKSHSLSLQSMRKLRQLQQELIVVLDILDV